MLDCWNVLSRPGVTAAGLTLALGCLAAAPAAAMPVSFELQIDLNSRNSPILTLKNTSLTDSLSAFQFTIGDTGFWFDEVSLFASGTSDPGGDLSVVLLSPSPNLQNDRVDSDLLSMTFTGFDPGDILVFELELDRDGNNGNVKDLVFFANGTAPNSDIAVGFSDGSQVNVTLPENPSMPGDIVTISQAAPAAQQVTEPTTLGLLGIGLLGLAATVRRRRSAKY